MDNALEVLFTLPADIQYGLEIGDYVRNGGVIQKTTGEVVMWLKEVIPRSDVSIIDPLSPTSVLAGGGIQPAILGLMVVNHIATRQLMNEIKTQLEGIQTKLESIEYKIDLRFEALLNGAFELFDKSDVVQDQQLKREFLSKAISNLAETKHIYLELVKREIDRDSRLSFFYIKILLHITVLDFMAKIRLGEPEMAVKAIDSFMQNTKPIILKYIKASLTDNPAIYLHKDLIDEYRLDLMSKIISYLDNRTVSPSLLFYELKDRLYEIYQKESKVISSLPKLVWDKSLDELPVNNGGGTWYKPITNFFSSDNAMILQGRLNDVFTSCLGLIDAVGVIASKKHEVTMLRESNMSLEQVQTLLIDKSKEHDIKAYTMAFLRTKNREAA